MLKNKPNFIDLFSGAGGFTKGFLKAGYNCLLTTDNWEAAENTHLKNFKKINFLKEDIIKMSFKKKYKNVDVLIGGPPCQGFSTIGKRMADDLRNNLILNFARAVKEIKPKFFLMENVRGISNKRYEDLLNEFYKIINKSGYKNNIKQVLCAADYGIPQLRYRTFFLGTIYPNLELSFPKKIISDKASYVTIKNYIKDLEGKENKLPNHVPMKHNKIVRERISFIKEGKGLEGKIPPRLMKGSRSDFKNNKLKNFSHIYKRLSYKKPSTTMVPGHNAFPLHPTLNRSLTVREAARIQTFDDKFEFIGSRQEQCILVGNAVPVELSKILARHIKKML